MTTISGMIESVILITAFTIISSVIAAMYFTPNAANAFAKVNSTNQQTLNHEFFGPMNKSAYSNSGFGSSIQNSLGFAFILPFIYQFMLALIRIPTIMLNTFNIVFIQTEIPSMAALPTASLSALILLYLSTFITVKGASGWNKYDYWNS